MIDDKELAQLFKAESAEHLACLDDGLLRLEKNQTDSSLLEAVFRASHSLKGAARMLGLSGIEAAAHQLETVLNTARHGQTPLTQEMIGQMTRVLAGLRKQVNLACDVQNPAQSNDVVCPQAAGGAVAAEQATSATRYHAEGGVKNEADVQSANGAPQFGAPQSDVQHAEISTQPSALLQPARPSQQLLHPFRIETVRVATQKLDELLTLTGELVVIEGRAQHRVSLMNELLEDWAGLKKQAGLGSAKVEHKIAAFGSRLNAARDAINEDEARLGATVVALQDRVHAIRLLPLDTVFSLFPRMVHDLAAGQGKDVEFIIEGGEIGVDKRILEEMKDPLIHLLRNAIDHGIETPDERGEMGKPRIGRLWLRAAREGDAVRLEVSDDGCGLDLFAIRQAALQRGLFEEAELAAMSAAQIQQLIFLSGFTTRSVITELSGRGIGLDVVRVNVERLKGEIRIDSTLHLGTRMQIRLPLSLSTTRLLIVAAGEHLYGLPTEFVHRATRVSEASLFTLEGHTAVEMDEEAVIAPRLCDLLGLQSTGRENLCIVLRLGDERLGLRVDELLDEQDVIAKPPGAPLVRVRHVSGLATLSSGALCVILNPVELLKTAHKAGMEWRTVPPSERHAVADAPIAKRQDESPRAETGTQQSALNHPQSNASQPVFRILLVEDSALVCAMEKRILVEAGYEVVTAPDGIAGLDALARHDFAAVVSDINMPNMDGLTLTARIRQEARYKDLPVILVTTLSSDDDKRRGLEAGANAYIPKPSFDQRVLLDTLKRLI